MASNCTIEDLPDDVLERIFSLAGQHFSPAIVGVSKRWWRVCWGHRELWRELNLSFGDVGPPLNRTLAPPEDPLPLPYGEQQQALKRRAAGWEAATLALLERIGGLAEEVTLTDDRAAKLPPSDVLPLLDPGVLRKLSLLCVGLQEEHVLELAPFSCLASLTILVSTSAAVFAVLPRLAQLERLSLSSQELEVQLPALLALTGLTRLELDALQSFSFSGAYESGLQLADFRFQLLQFRPLMKGDASPPAAEVAAIGRPGMLKIDGIAIGEPLVPAAGGDGDGAGGEQALGPPFNALLVAALPLGATLQRLELVCCNLATVSLQQLPALARLQHLAVRRCRGPGSMDAPLQALVQAAPALTELFLHAQKLKERPGEQLQASYCLRAWPVYMLAHPSLRRATLHNRQPVECDMQEALPSSSTAAPVLEHLATDCFASIPPFLAGISSLHSLAFQAPPEQQPFELGSAGIDVLLALPHLASLEMPCLAEGGQQAVERLRAERPQLSIRVAAEGAGGGQ